MGKPIGRSEVRDPTRISIHKAQPKRDNERKADCVSLKSALGSEIPMVFRVLIVVDTRLYREGLARILTESPRIDVVGEAGTRDECVRKIRSQRPQIILLESSMLDSWAALKEEIGLDSRIHVVALGVPDDEESVFSCAEAGVSSYVPRESSILGLLACLEATWRNELCCSPRIARSLFRRLGAGASARETPLQPWNLTVQERKIAKQLNRGLSNKEIAQELSISVSTVKNHVHHLLEKLQVHRRGEAAATLREHLP
jgi:DNA-binding NarL/FixJ family response regulator